MKLVASVIAHNEEHRYLEPFLLHLNRFCDDIRLLDDGSTDQTRAVASGLCDGILVQPPGFFEHEGKARNALLAYTLTANPTHILAIDCDEFVTDPQAVRNSAAAPGDIFTLTMEEVWKADEDSLYVRVDGGWKRRQVPILYRVPARRGRDFLIANRPMACGREPQQVSREALRGRAHPSGSSILHFGWARESERQARYDRYVTHDLGKTGGHADEHLRSIMWPDDRVTLEPRPWPDTLPKADLLDIIRR